MFKIKFHTRILGVKRSLYDQIILKFILDAMAYDSISKLDNQTFHVWPVNDYVKVIGDRDFRTEDTGKLNYNMPHGLNEINDTHVFILDTKSQGLELQMNAWVISHELAHLVLRMTMPGVRMIMPVDDIMSGIKKGTSINVSTGLVHVRYQEGISYFLDIWYKVNSWLSQKVRILDIRNL